MTPHFNTLFRKHPREAARLVRIIRSVRKRRHWGLEQEKMLLDIMAQKKLVMLNRRDGGNLKIESSDSGESAPN